MNTLIACVLACVAAFASAELPAQQTFQSGIGQAARPHVSATDSIVARDMRGLHVTRTVVGLAGEFVGFAIGGTVGYMVYEFRGRGFSGGDDPGLAEIVLGMMVGGVIGTATGAAFPKGHNDCTPGRRFKLALFGAVVGGAAGIVILNANGSGTTAVAALAAPSTAAYALKGC
ncbi:MAG: hypothetical protein M3R07_04680 [Gemmatimonadota bacterium]|nr:hypothetical protein [Gemmatimonadota bacterium]